MLIHAGPYLLLFCQQFSEVDNITVFLLSLRKLRCREVKVLTSVGPLGSKWCS